MTVLRKEKYEDETIELLDALKELMRKLYKHTANSDSAYNFGFDVGTNFAAEKIKELIEKYEN